MKTTIYRNYDPDCKHFHSSRFDPFGYCLNPAVFNDIGIENHWVVNCSGCEVRSLAVSDFHYKLAILEVKLKERHQNDTK